MNLQDYQREFLDFAIDTGVLRFGRFTLKSGRITPYMFDTGLFNTGASLEQLGNFYAQAIVDSGIEFDMLYGPAYKGIPLASATSIALAHNHNIDTPYAFNRKEIKDHGEGGLIVGSELKGKVLVIDDVISSGTEIKETYTIIQQTEATMCGVMIALDRQERGSGSASAIQELESDFGVKVASIINLEILIKYLEEKPKYNKHLQELPAYLQQYGVTG